MARPPLRRWNCLHNYAPIKREEGEEGAGEGNSHFDSGAIKLRLRKNVEKKKRHARKEWNLIRSSCSLVFPGSHEETRRSRGVHVRVRTSRKIKRDARGVLSNRRKTQCARVREREGRREEGRGGEKLSNRGEKNVSGGGIVKRRHNNQEYDNTRRMDGYLHLRSWRGF